jgi:hypothetical protein
MQRTRDNWHKNMVLVSPPTLVTTQTLGTRPDNCGVQLSRVERGWRFTSQRERFTSFTVTSSLIHWDAAQGLCRFQGWVVHFPDTAARFRFRSGSILLVYPSGHIRWVTALGLQYYAVLSQSTPPRYCQGDLVIFALGDGRLIPQRHALAALLPPDQSAIWCRARPVASAPNTSAWVQVDEIPLGGNTRHKAVGRLRFSTPIPNDHRSMQIHTLDDVWIQHDPVDDIHPTICLPPQRHFLITKLPGFSDPVCEMKPCKELFP